MQRGELLGDAIKQMVVALCATEHNQPNVASDIQALSSKQILVSEIALPIGLTIGLDWYSVGNGGMIDARQ